eukprot:TRINITY_DN12969_c0_g1_i1.p4 TRINITY_DN12969_c0_g1~~TRINITY_DN12969_c0_g1_i1.p4  ORF type:complete len:130 (+),score=30.62 TRINITY_DN12969_c0_g1_i1:120-509(+)
MTFSYVTVFVFFFKQKTAYEMLRSLVGSEMCIRDRAYESASTLYWRTRNGMLPTGGTLDPTDLFHGRRVAPHSLYACVLAWCTASLHMERVLAIIWAPFCSEASAMSVVCFLSTGGRSCSLPAICAQHA